MKKLFIAVLMAVLVTPALTSCDKDVRKCWAITYTVSGSSASADVTVYKWCSTNELDAEIEKLKETFGKNLHIKSKKVNKEHSTAEACVAANINNK